MDESSLDDIAGQLTDLEVAIFLCLVAHEQCLVETTAECIHDLAKELALVSKASVKVYCRSILTC